MFLQKDHVKQLGNWQAQSQRCFVSTSFSKKDSGDQEA